MLQLFDTHCHLDFAHFDPDRPELIGACTAAGINGIVVPGTEPNQWPGCRRLADDFPSLYFAVGIHPWWVAKTGLQHDISDAFDRVLLTSPHRALVAIGECGLDGSIAIPLDVQQRVLELQLAFAKEHCLPVILHSHRAHNEMIRLLKRYKLERGGVVHGFSGSVDLARTYWQMGFYLGVGGVITYERAKKTRETVAAMPLSSVLLESDAPDMPLSGCQGQRNTPLAIIEVAKVLARLRGQTVDEVAAQTTQNAKTLFAL